MRNEEEVVECRIERVDFSCSWVLLGAVVDEPSCHVGVQCVGHCVEQVLQYSQLDVFEAIFSASYLVHAANKREIGARVILRGNEEAVALRRGDIDHARLGRLCVDSVDFNNAHVVALKPHILRSKGTHVDNSEHVSLPWLHSNGQVLGIVHER